MYFLHVTVRDHLVGLGCFATERYQAVVCPMCAVLATSQDIPPTPLSLFIGQESKVHIRTITGYLSNLTQEERSLF